MEPAPEVEAIDEELQATMRRLIHEHSSPNIVFHDRRLLMELMHPSVEEAVRKYQCLTCIVVFRRIQPAGKGDG